MNPNKRLLSLDVLRGITVAGMILVNNTGKCGYNFAAFAHAKWDGFSPADLVFPMFMFLMGTETAVHSVSADFMQVVGAEVFLPESVTISISDDGANFTELKQYTFEVNRKEAIKFISISWEGSAEGRYIRYQARAGEEFGGWIFTDEIVVK